MEDNIKVVVRTRPLNKREIAANCSNLVTCSEADKSVHLHCKPESKHFTFDHVAGEDSTQEGVFQHVGVPLTESCLQGFNGTIIAYGQTGSGKTHTLFGSSGNDTSSERGLVPRVFEYLWQKMSTAELSVAADAPSYSCKCSFYEIYNERVFDLLAEGGTGAGGGSSHGPAGLSIREDQKKGVYVDGITEAAVSSPADASRVLKLGYRNRHVGCTAMNRDSSRSHAVFLLTVAVNSINSSGLLVTNSATFSLVDLAGSERQKATQAEGVRLKEASKINQSLSTLGSVIHALSVAVGNSKATFVRYRDSALTFLLRDSLGGNSKTVLIAAISPSSDAMSETLGTLKFAQRAKTVRNVVSANTFTNGTVEALQKEIRELRGQLDAMQSLPPLPPPLEGTDAERLSSGRNSFDSSNSSSSSRSSSKSKSAQLSPAGSLFVSICDKALLSDSLQRFAAMDGARVRAEVRAHALGKQLEASEKSLQTALANTTVSSTGGLEAVELSRYKLRCQQLEARMAEDKEGGVWDNCKESAFGAAICSRVADAEKKCLQLDAQYQQMTNHAFATDTGLTVDEAKSLHARCQQLATRAEAEERQNSLLNIRVLQLEQTLSGAGIASAEGAPVLQSPAETVSMMHHRDRCGMLAGDLHAWHSSALAMAAGAAGIQERLAAVTSRVTQEEAACRAAQEGLRSVQGQLLQASADLQRCSFERDEATERADTAETQCESLRAENTELQVSLKNLTAQAAALQAQMGTLAALTEPEAAVALKENVRLQDQIIAEIAAREQAEAASTTALDDLALSRDVIADLSRENHQQGQHAREMQQQLEEATSVKAELLVAAADDEQERALMSQKISELQIIVSVLQKDLQNVNIAPGASAAASAAASQNDPGLAHSAADAETIRTLRTDLLQALQKVEQSTQVRSNLVTCQSELQAVKCLYEGSKAAALEAEQRASAMMAQLVELSGGLHSRSHGQSSQDSEALQEQVAKLERRLKKATAERDASRDVLKDLEDGAEDGRRKLQAMEAAIAEVRMENTKLREGGGYKGKDKDQLAALQTTIKERDSKIVLLREQREQYRTEAAKVRAELRKLEPKPQQLPAKLASNEAELPGNVSMGRRRGLSNRNTSAADFQHSPVGL